MNEYLSFRRMITPTIIQLIFWIVVAASVIGGVVQIADGEGGKGLLILLLGPLVARIYAELLIVVFRINDNLADLRAAKLGQPPQG